MEYEVIVKHTNKVAGRQFHEIGEIVSLTPEEAKAPLRNLLIKEKGELKDSPEILIDEKTEEVIEAPVEEKPKAKKRGRPKKE